MARPCGLSAASTAGPRMPLWMRAARLVASTSSTRSRRRRSRLTAPAYPSPTAGSTPPTTEEPPPKGMTATFAPLAQSSTAASSASLAGRATRSGVGEVARGGADRFGIGLAVGVQQPLVRVVCDKVCQRRRRDDARRPQSDVCGCRRRRKARLDAEILGDETKQMLALGVSQAGVLEPPAIEFEPRHHGEVSLGLSLGAPRDHAAGARGSLASAAASAAD